MPKKTYHRACIVAFGYMTKDGSRRSVGGIQTYVDALKTLLSQVCEEVYILQPSDTFFELEESENVKIIGIPCSGHDVARYYKANFEGGFELTICTHLDWLQWYSGPGLIAIQHGIGWDGFKSRTRGAVRVFRKFHYEHIAMWKNRQLMKRCMAKAEKVICVDLNFPNWMRATFPTGEWERKLHYVPNFGDPISESEVAAKLAKYEVCTSVLIARRFQINRGLPMMAEIVAEIYDKWPNVRFVFGGWGDQEDRVREVLAGKERCEIIRLAPEEVPEANRNADIVAIPTLWSEGTSLSCIEGMCAGAAVLATNIGGLGNIILPDYNGLLVAPRRADIKDGLERLLGDVTLRKKLAKRGFETARTSFSRASWEERILRVLLD